MTLIDALADEVRRLSAMCRTFGGPGPDALASAANWILASHGLSRFAATRPPARLVERVDPATGRSTLATLSGAALASSAGAGVDAAHDDEDVRLLVQHLGTLTRAQSLFTEWVFTDAGQAELSEICRDLAACGERLATDPSRVVNAPPAPEPFLEEGDVKILRVLAHRPHAHLLVDLAEQLHAGRNTVSRRTARLVEAGLLARARPRGGVVLTATGRAALDRFGRPAAAAP